MTASPHVLGLPVGPDEFRSLEAHDAAVAAFAVQRRFHLVWHRIWGVRLRAEIVLGRLSGRCGDLRRGAPSQFAIALDG